jgi:GNAT superfamily N-acetyltransferase
MQERENALANLDSAWVTCMRAFAAGSSGRVHEYPDSVSIENEVSFPVFSGVMRARLAADTALERAAELKRKFGSTHHNWIVNPLATPANLTDILESMGGHTVVTLLGMSMRLDELAPAPPLPDGIVFRRPESADEAREYARVIAVLFGAPLEGWVDQLAEVEAELFESGRGAWLRNIAVADGQIVAAAGFTITDGVVALQTFSTLPEWRNRGIGAAMATAELLRSRDEGCHSSVVWANPEARTLYERMGYREVCTGDVIVF